MLEFDDWVQTTYDDNHAAVAALVSDSASFDPNNSWDVEAAVENVRSRSVTLHDRICPIEDGVITDPVAVCNQLQCLPGMQMRGPRALRELEFRASRPAIVYPSDLEDELFYDESLHATFDPADPFRPLPPALLPESLIKPNECADPIGLPDGQRYWPRQLADRTDVEILREARGLAHVRLSGPPGAGKTALVAATFGEDVITVQGHSELTVAGLYGQYLPGRAAGDPAWVWHDGPLVRAMREGKVLLVDEINRAPSDVDEALLSATDSRHSVVVSDRPDLPAVQSAPGFMVIATYNDADTGIRQLSSSLARRLNLHIRVETDFQVARAEGVDPGLLLVAKNLRTSAQIESREQGGAPVWWPQMADLRGAQRLLSLGLQPAFAALTASATEPARIRLAADIFSTTYGIDVDAVTALGVGAAGWRGIDAGMPRSIL